MSGVDLTSQASLQLGQTLTGLRQLRTEIETTEKSVRRYNEATKTLQQTQARASTSTSKDFGKSIQNGGQLGSFSNKIIQGGSMDGVFGRISVAVTAAAASMRLFSAASDISVDRARMLTQALERQRQVVEQADRVMQAQAGAGLSQPGAQADFAALGPEAQEALKRASKKTDSGDAAEAIKLIFGKFGAGEKANDMVNLAMRGLKGGLSMTEVAQEVTRKGSTVNNPEQFLGGMARRKYGRFGDDTEIWQEREDNVANSELAKANRAAAEERAKQEEIERKRAIERAAADAQRETAKAANPLSAKQNEDYLAREREKKALQNEIDATMPIVRFFETWLGLGAVTELKKINIADASAAGFPIKHDGMSVMTDLLRDIRDYMKKQPPPSTQVPLGPGMPSRRPYSPF
jgi:hypothetical protein